jgi:hypoxanthine phosphoribosyltransferase
MSIKLRIALSIVLICIAVGIGAESVYVSSVRPLSNLEASLLTIFLWLISAMLGWTLSSIYADYAATNSLQERAKPAIRRVWELQRSAEQLQLMLATNSSRERRENSSVSSDFSAEAFAIQMQIGQLRAAVQDWRELLPQDYVEDVIQQAASEERPNAIPWHQFHYLVNKISEQVDRSDAYGGFRPDILVGVYPEGGLVGYLMWLTFRRRCQLMLMPDGDLEKDEKMLELVKNNLSYHANGRTNLRILVVDASIKSGRSMQSTVTAVREACKLANITPELASACVIDYPVPGTRSDNPNFLGIKGHFHLPFSES